jgi:hypothetical protein
MHTEEIVIDPAFEGPPGTANGGYACGLVARRFPEDAQVTLRKPLPLGVGLRLRQREGRLEVRLGVDVVAEARTAPAFDGHMPDPPALDEAERASHRFPGFDGHAFPRCVVCGTERTDDAAFRVFPGPVDGRPMLAAVWDPRHPASAGGAVRPELGWAALDCPGGWAAMWFGRPRGALVLGRMAARLPAPIPPDEPLVVAAWLDSVEGRKFRASSALFSRDGTLVGRSAQTWIELARTEVAS